MRSPSSFDIWGAVVTSLWAGVRGGGSCSSSGQLSCGCQVCCWICQGTSAVANFSLLTLQLSRVYRTCYRRTIWDLILTWVGEGSWGRPFGSVVLPGSTTVFVSSSLFGCRQTASSFAWVVCSCQRGSLETSKEQVGPSAVTSRNSSNCRAEWAVQIVARSHHWNHQCLRQYWVLSTTSSHVCTYC